MLAASPAGAEPWIDFWRGEDEVPREPHVDAYGAYRPAPQVAVLPGGRVAAHFDGEDARHGRELWITDGTEDGTLRVADVWPGAQSSRIGHLHPRDHAAMFSAEAGGPRLWWRTDGTPAGTKPVPYLGPGHYSAPRDDYRAPLTRIASDYGVVHRNASDDQPCLLLLAAPAQVECLVERDSRFDDAELAGRVGDRLVVRIQRCPRGEACAAARHFEVDPVSPGERRIVDNLPSVPLSLLGRNGNEQLLLRERVEDDESTRRLWRIGSDGAHYLGTYALGPVWRTLALGPGVQLLASRVLSRLSLESGEIERIRDAGEELRPQLVVPVDGGAYITAYRGDSDMLRPYFLSASGALRSLPLTTPRGAPRFTGEGFRHAERWYLLTAMLHEAV